MLYTVLTERWRTRAGHVEQMVILDCRWGLNYCVQITSLIHFQLLSDGSTQCLAQLMQREGQESNQTAWAAKAAQRRRRAPSLGCSGCHGPSPPPRLNWGLLPLLPVFQHLQSFNIYPYVHKILAPHGLRSLCSLPPHHFMLQAARPGDAIVS